MNSSLTSITGYGVLLLKMWGLYTCYENRMARFHWSSAGIDFGLRRRAHWLPEDLAGLGLSRPALPAIAHVPSTHDEAFGSLYVMEGSSLGGQILRAQSSAVKRYHAHPRREILQWARSISLCNEYLICLDRFDVDSNEAVDIELSASRTFAAFAWALRSKTTIPLAGHGFQSSPDPLMTSCRTECTSTQLTAGAN